MELFGFCSLECVVVSITCCLAVSLFIGLFIKKTNKKTLYGVMLSLLPFRFKPAELEKYFFS